MKLFQKFAFLISILSIAACQKQIDTSTNNLEIGYSSVKSSTVNLNTKDDDLNSSVKKGLLAYYPFSGNANDASGNGNNGTLVNNVQFGADRNGLQGSAFDLAGGANNGRIVTNSSFFNFQYNNSFSISYWVLDAGSYGGRLVSNENSEGNFRIASYGNGVYAIAFGSSVGYLYDTLTLNTWTHITYTYENRSVKLYKNGILKTVGINSSIYPFNYGAPFTIGAKAAPSYDNWLGKLDELRIYNRALTSKEAKYLATH